MIAKHSAIGLILHRYGARTRVRFCLCVAKPISTPTPLLRSLCVTCGRKK